MMMIFVVVDIKKGTTRRTMMTVTQDKERERELLEVQKRDAAIRHYNVTIKM